MWKRIISCLAIAFILGGTLMASSMADKPKESAVVFYVAPDGDDQGPGNLDKPFASLQRARNAVRELKRQQGGALNQPVTVFVRGGTYFLSKPLTFAPEDSGTAECPVTFAAYQKEKPVISGGRRITGWKQATVDGKKLWAAEIDDVRTGKWFFRQIWVNGQRRVRSRHPEKGYLKVVASPDATDKWNEGQSNFQFKAGDLKAWKTAKEAEMVVMCRWVDSHLPIDKVDEENQIVSFGKQSVFRIEAGDPYYVEHAFELLGAQGQWYLDREKGVIYYTPMPGEDMSSAEVIAPVLSQLVRMEGEPQAGKFVDYLVLRGLNFSHTEWWLPKDSRVGGFSQAAVGVPGAVFGDGVRHCALENCAIVNIGNYALELSRGCQNNRVDGCVLSDLGAGGVKIGETRIRDNETEHTYGNVIRNCHIHDGGVIFHPAVGIWVGQSYNNHFIRNHIHDFYYSGFSVGWTWGYGKTLARGNVVDSNHVHHIGVRSDGDGPILSDMGGIYTLGMQPETVVRHNVFHDIAGYRYGGWGIYFDEGSTHIVAENNLVYRTTHGGFHQHYGRENIVRNNIFAFGRDQQIQRTRPEPHSSFTFERNIVYWREGKLLAGNISDLNFSFDRNIYWDVRQGEIKVDGMSLDEWREKGMDKESLVVDPLFVDPDKGNFHLKPDSPAIKWFTPFELPD